MLRRDLRHGPDRDGGDGLRLPRPVRGALAALGLTLAGCAARPPAPPVPPTPPAPAGPSAPAVPDRAWEGGRELASHDGAWRVRYRLDPDPIPRGDTFALDAWVFAADAPEAPREDVALAVDAAMPEHGHGMNRVPRVEAVPGGRFRAEGLLFHMPGRWELYFDVTRGGITERAQAEIVLE